MAWVGTDTIVCIRSSNGTDIVEIYSYSDNTVELVDTVYSEPIGTLPIRSARPIVDVNGDYYIWHRGFYNPANYTTFNTDAMIRSVE